MNPQIIVKTYRGTEVEATAAFQRDAPMMFQQGYARKFPPLDHSQASKNLIAVNCERCHFCEINQF
jgi:hypothetical protein